MSVETYVEVAERARVGERVHDLPASSPVRVGWGRRRQLVTTARWAVPMGLGTGAALVAGTPAVVVCSVLAVWLLVHVCAPHTWLDTGLPKAGDLLRGALVPFGVAAAGIAAGVFPEQALTGSLMVALATTAGLVVVAGVDRLTSTPARRVVVVGDARSVATAAAAWRGRRDVNPVGACVLGPGGTPTVVPAETLGLPVVTGTDALHDVVGALAADLVMVVGATAGDADAVRRLAWALEDTDAGLLVRTELASAHPHRLRMTRLADCALVAVAPSRARWHVRATKQVLDRAGAALLLVLLAPVLVAMVAAVRLESPGRGLFTQIRVGQDGRPFRVFKVRTMCAAAEQIKGSLGDADEGNGLLFKIRQDPRVTRVGRLLRRTSLDELPQLINVLRGEMSLVGPRPALPDEVARYDETTRRRLAVRPGMTGLWQVSGRSDLDLETAMSLDLRYTDNVTVTEDLRICLRTVGAVATGRGAY